MNKSDFIKEKSRELAEYLLELIKEVKPRSIRIKPTSDEVSKIKCRLEEIFNGHDVDDIPKLYEDIKRAFSHQRDKAKQDEVQMKYFRMETFVRPLNFRRTVEWNLEELDKLDQKEARRVANVSFKASDLSIDLDDF